MKVAIMQPYLFPYIGYFQLVNAVNLFVFLNDVNFIKKGWINRNRILLDGKDFVFTVPCKNVSQNKRICHTEVSLEQEQRMKILRTIEHAYKKAPFFDKVYPLIESVFESDYSYIDELAIFSVTQTCHYLGINTAFKRSASLYNNEELKKGARLIDICHQENSTEYINPKGGMDIYSKEQFLKDGIQLSFLSTGRIQYAQFGDSFLPDLSIIDMLMFNHPEEISGYLNRFELI